MAKYKGTREEILQQLSPKPLLQKVKYPPGTAPKPTPPPQATSSPGQADK
jgi:hypothetical protein